MLASPLPGRHEFRDDQALRRQSLPFVGGEVTRLIRLIPHLNQAASRLSLHPLSRVRRRSRFNAFEIVQSFMAGSCVLPFSQSPMGQQKFFRPVLDFRF